MLFTNTFKDLIEKESCVLERMGNFSRELKVLKRECLGIPPPPSLPPPVPHTKRGLFGNRYWSVLENVKIAALKPQPLGQHGGTEG